MQTTRNHKLGNYNAQIIAARLSHQPATEPNVCVKEEHKNQHKTSVSEKVEKIEQKTPRIMGRSKSIKW